MNNHNLEERYKEYLDNKTETSGCTFEEYKHVYPRLMNKHITTGVAGRNELQFIRREIENHAIILEGVKASMLKISDFDYRRLNFDPIEKNFGQEKFLNTMASYENMRDSHELIIEYLETKKSELEATQQQAPSDKKEKVPVIALLYYYNGQYITRDNAQSIANKYGYNAKTSGEGLYHDFAKYAVNANRKASGGNKLKCNNRIKIQNRVIKLLIDENAKSKAITELDILKAKLINLS